MFIAFLKIILNAKIDIAQVIVLFLL